jgi:FHA domain
MGGANTPRRRRWQQQLHDGRVHGWYRTLTGTVDQMRVDHGMVMSQVRTAQGLLEVPADFVIDCTGLEADIAEHRVLADLLAYSEVGRNPLGRLDVERSFELRGAASGPGVMYASGATTLGGYFPGVDTFLGLQIAAQEITDGLARRGFCLREPSRVLPGQSAPRVLRAVPRGVAGRQRADAGAVHPVAVQRREAGMTESMPRPGLWPIPGEGVLARQGDLILLASIADGEFADSLLALLEKTAGAGGDGRQLADAVADLLADHASWPASWEQPGPAVVAFGPAGPGVAVTICGAVYAEISTAAGTQRLVPGPPQVQLRCLLSEPATVVRSELGTGDTVTGRPDRFSHLDQGTIRAGGLVYVPSTTAPDRDTELAAAEPAAAGEPPKPAPTGHDTGPIAAGRDNEPVAIDDQTDTIATARPAAPAPTGRGTGPEPVARVPVDRGPVDREPEPAPAGPQPDRQPEPTPAGRQPDRQPEATPASHQPGPAFEAMLLVGTPPGEVEHRPALPRDPLESDSLDQSAALTPSVLGVYCKNGHFDDPAARFCAVCGISMNQQTLVPRAGPRPPLGVLAFDDGSIFQLDSDYVIGREPTLNAAVAAGQARPLCVVDESGIVSRAHAALQLDGWRVLVTDLGSANGTRLRHRADEATQQLTPHVSVELFPGSHVDLGGCGFRYESHRGH